MIVDAHLDIAYAAWALHRDFTRSAHQTRAAEAASNPAQARDICTVGLPDMQRGGIGLAFGSIFVEPAYSVEARAGYGYHTPEEANSQARLQLEYYQRLMRDAGLLAVRSQADLDKLQHPGPVSPAIGLLVEMEGSESILAPSDVAWWWEQGVRQIGLAWSYGSRYCAGNRQPGPLKEQAPALLREMDRAGMILDVSHLAEQGFWQALDMFHGPVVASHANCRALVPGERQLSDDMIKAIAGRGGMIGTVFFNAFLRAGWTRGQGKSMVTLADVVRHVDHICQVTGDSSHVGIGSDLDGGFGAEATPAEIDTIADLPRLGPALTAAGYSADATAGILGDNWLRFLRSALPAPP